MGTKAHTESPRAFFLKSAAFAAAAAALSFAAWSASSAWADPPTDPPVCCRDSLGACTPESSCPQGTTRVNCPCPPPYSTR